MADKPYSELTLKELTAKRDKAKVEKLNHEFGTYQYDIWNREVKTLDNCIRTTIDNILD